MLNKETVLFWNEVEHDLYEEDGHIFGIELDLFNNHKNYYCKTIENGVEHYQYLTGDIYVAIDQFNEIVFQGGADHEFNQNFRRPRLYC